MRNNYRLLTLSLCAIFSILFSQNILLAEQNESREITSFGVSKKEAVANALVEAIQQVKGIRISGSETVHSLFMEQDITQKGINEFNSLMQNSQSQETLKEFQGVISSYEIIDVSRDMEGRGWNATLNVSVPVYKTPGISPHNRRKIAIIPFRTPKKHYSFYGQKIPSWEISRQLTGKLVTEITQTRKFTVLDREYTEQFLQERNILLSPDASVTEQAKIGEMLGVDYLILGTITNASIKRTKHTVPMVNEVIYKDKAIFIADYCIMVMATRQIKWSGSVSISLNSKELKKLVPEASPELIQQAVLSKAAKDIVQHSMENIFPIRIAQIQGYGQFILNQGGTTVTSGDKLDVYKPGEKVIDQYTGESLGSAESWVATLQIVRVIPKMFYAKAIRGSMDAVQEGYICRRVNIADNISRTGGVSW